jgi:hypothetical protein
VDVWRIVALAWLVPVSALARPWTGSTLALTLGPQVVGNHFGGEASLILFELNGHVTGGAGIAAGATSAGGYAEAEAILILTPHDDAAAKLGHEYPGLAFTAGGGPAVRWDGARGWQATVTGAIVFLPIMIVVRLEKLAGPPAVIGGVMLKLPVWMGL